MHRVLKAAVEELDRKFECLQISLEEKSWIARIPSEAGWYLVKTNTPIKVLKSVGKPTGKAHTDIPETINKNSTLQRHGIVIAQTDDEEYVVYSGEARNLRARAREHVYGYPGTYCLGLSEYERLRKYRWTFCYVVISSCEVVPNGDKPFRSVVEQAWRAKSGWPVLCRR